MGPHPALPPNAEATHLAVIPAKAGIQPSSPCERRILS